MVGKILHFDAQQGTGIIRGDDGNRYQFLSVEVRNFNGMLSVGAEVDFEVDEQMHALEIYVLSGNVAPQQHTHMHTQTQAGVHVNSAPFMGSSNKMDFKELSSLEGCYTRGQYWKIILLLAVYSAILYVIGALTYKETVHTGFSMVDGVAGAYGRYKHITSVMFWGGIPSMWILFAATVKRFHDLNKSGAWILINLIPFIGSLVSFIMTGLMEGNHYNNRYCTRAADMTGGNAQNGVSPVNAMHSNSSTASPSQTAAQSSSDAAAFTMPSVSIPSIDIALIKKYKKQILIGIPLIIAFCVWFVYFRSVTVPDKEVENDGYIGKGILRIMEDPHRQNFTVAEEISSGMIIPKEMMEYVKEVDGTKRFELEVSLHKIVQGVQKITYTYEHSSDYDNVYAFWKDGVYKATFFYRSGNLVMVNNWDSNGKMAACNAYDENGRIYKTVKFVNGEGKYKKYYPESKLQLVESYNLNSNADDAIKITLYDQNGSVIDSYRSQNNLISAIRYDLKFEQLLK